MLQMAIIYPVTCHQDTTGYNKEYGNCVVAGHSSVKYDCIFNKLKDLSIGETITAYAENGTAYTYTIMYKYVVKPTETGILRTTDENIRIRMLQMAIIYPVTCHQDTTGYNKYNTYICLHFI